MASSPDDVVLTSSPVTTQERDGVPCEICRRQFSKYTCPSCNVGYCSLQCFRSESHTSCSEKFYRKELESDIKAAPSKTAQEREKMMALLKRFEEESSDAGLEDGLDDEEDDKNELAQRLADLDLDAAPFDQVWDRLTSQERKTFLKAVVNPSSELARRLLVSEDLEKELQQPWWEAPFDNGGSSAPAAKRYGVKPSLAAVPQSMVKPSMRGPSLYYNICAIFIAYAYVTRRLSISPLGSLSSDDPDRAAARSLVGTIVPFLTDRGSKVVHPSLSSVVTDAWSRFDYMNAALFSVLLCDVAQLIRPLPVTVVPSAAGDNTARPLDAHPHRTAILVLSDLIKLFESKHASSPAQEHAVQNHVTHKLRFYAATVLSTTSYVFVSLAQELLIKSKSIQGEEK